MIRYKNNLVIAMKLSSVFNIKILFFSVFLPISNIIKKMIFYSILAVTTAVIYSILWTSPEVCDLSKPENRNYKVYYGLENSNIPFGKNSAEQNTDAPLFEPIIRENIENSPSIIVIGEYGSGKTQIRNYRLAKYDQKKTLVTYLLGNKLDKYLDVYFKSRDNLIKNMSSNDILSIIISEIVENILNLDISNQVVESLKLLKYDERVRLAYLIAVYSNLEKKSSLVNLINELLFEKTKCWTCYSARFNCNLKKQSEYDELRLSLDRFRTTYEDQKDKLAHLLYCMNDEISEMPKNFLSVSQQRHHIRTLSNFLNKVFDKKLVIVIDSLDENTNLFNGDTTPNLTNLQAVANSVLNSDVLTLALGNREDIVFDILVFMPLVKNLKINWAKKDKIPVIELKWSAKMLENYADFVFDNLKKQQKNECKTLPTFKGLLGDNDALVKYVFDNLKNPREFHLFMNLLLNKLNEKSSIKGVVPFKASKEDVENVMEQAKNDMYKRN